MTTRETCRKRHWGPSGESWSDQERRSSPASRADRLARQHAKLNEFSASRSRPPATLPWSTPTGPSPRHSVHRNYHDLAKLDSLRVAMCCCKTQVFSPRLRGCGYALRIVASGESSLRAMLSSLDPPCACSCMLLCQVTLSMGTDICQHRPRKIRRRSSLGRGARHRDQNGLRRRKGRGFGWIDVVPGRHGGFEQLLSQLRRTFLGGCVVVSGSIVMSALREDSCDGGQKCCRHPDLQQR